MKQSKYGILGVCLLGLIPATSGLAQERIQAQDMVALFEKLSGPQPGHRKAHARGLCATGTFAPVKLATGEPFAGAALLSSGGLPVLMRFSIGGGNPDADERMPGTRGLGLQIALPNGGLHNFTGNNFPVFAGKDVETFHGFLSTLLPDEQGKRDPQRTLDFADANPSVKDHMVWQKSAQTAASFANTEFYGLHTFYFDGADQPRVKFRWHLSPDLGVKTLTADQAQAKPAAFLAQSLAGQLEQGPVSFSLMASLGAPEDSDTDPSSQWPAHRPQVKLGTLTLQQSGGDQCTGKNFDPNVLSAGFSGSDDPVLKMRSPAYAISFGKRLSGQ
ncbi:catalase family peroxidase [Bowmanella dokdonensis]|uniref:Catalase-related peroxidase n=1 Tax=Bowmanella dokdonensis TaxID=751969 RepID=A0A939DP51_9ALTE|nr:catalase family peroxidase [Bowmanella dokdonensis]MBN7826164.1 catalase family peroxidase [Bowmanella dokdonensis]